MHDDMQVIRQLDFEKCLTDGQIPCRWVPDLGYGYGYPLFNYYPPLPYIVGQVWRTVGASFTDTVKFTALTQIILGAFFMYLLGASLTNKWGGLISALFFTYAPYHAVNIYIRGAMNEAWAATFFPLVLYFIRRAILDSKVKYYLGISLSFGLILLSHNPMALIFAPLAILWSLYWLFISQKQFLKTIVSLAMSVVLSLLFSAFYTLPLLVETKLVQIESMFSGYYHYSVHFATIKQLFISNFWGDGPSVWGTEDKMSFMIGYLHWILPIFVFIAYLFKFKKSHKFIDLFPPALVLIGFFSAFMSHERSTPFWQIFPVIQNVQFPWRFLNLTTFIFSTSIIFLVNLIKKPIFYVLIITSLLILNLGYFYPIHSGPVTDSQKFSGQSWRLLITASIYDYLPKSAETAPKSPSVGLIDEIIPSDISLTIKNEKHGTDWFFVNFNLNSDAQIIFGQLDFPNFLILDQDQPIPHFTENKLGRIGVNLKAGNHQLFAKLQNTPIRTLANLLSLVSWISLFICLIRYLWLKLTPRK
ncbi:MAG: glycosyltransferase family 39 protein [Candidatus Shapirobacteria bacterium]|jgi:hypothetical protein